MTTGYLREKDDIKYFILFAMSQLPFPVGEPDLLDICLIDDAFGYFEFSEAFAELQSTGHVRRLEDEEGKAVYTITPLGREAAQIFQEDLPISVRDKAQTAAAGWCAKSAGIPPSPPSTPLGKTAPSRCIWPSAIPRKRCSPWMCW